MIHGPRDLVTLGRALLLFSIAELGLRLTSLPTLCRWFGAELELSERPAGRRVRWSELSEADGAVLLMLERVGRHWPYARQGACLRHSLAAAHVLRSCGPCLRLAVGSEPTESLVAHAWIEVGGVSYTSPGQLSPLLPSPLNGQRP